MRFIWEIYSWIQHTCLVIVYFSWSHDEDSLAFNFFWYLQIFCLSVNKSIMLVCQILLASLKFLLADLVIKLNCKILHEGAFYVIMWSDHEDIETLGVSPQGPGWLLRSRVCMWGELRCLILWEGRTWSLGCFTLPPSMTRSHEKFLRFVCIFWKAIENMCNI